MSRPRRPSIAGASVGALFGAAVGGWPLTALGGQDTPLPLEEALCELCEERGFQLVSVDRVTKTAITLLFKRTARSYGSVEVEAAPQDDTSPEAIDDELYDRSVAAVDAWKAARGA